MTVAGELRETCPLRRPTGRPRLSRESKAEISEVLEEVLRGR